VRVTLFLFVCLPVVSADFSDDQFSQQPDILSRIIAAAQKYDEPGASLRSHRSENTTYYLRRAEYVGACEASFGTVHVARLFYIRSAPRGTSLPARGHTFILFLDAELQIRATWRVESDLGRLSISGTRFLLDGTPLLDYSALPVGNAIVVNGKLQEVPKWW